MINFDPVGTHPYSNGVYSQNANPSNNNTNAAEIGQSKQIQPAAEVPIRYTVSEEDATRYREQFDFSEILSKVSTIRPGMSESEKVVSGAALMDALKLLADLRDNGYLSDRDVAVAGLKMLGLSHLSPSQFSLNPTGTGVAVVRFKGEEWGTPQNLEHLLNLSPGNVPEGLAEKYDAETLQSFFRISNIFNQIFDVNQALLNSMGDSTAKAD